MFFFSHKIWSNLFWGKFIPEIKFVKPAASKVQDRIGLEEF